MLEKHSIVAPIQAPPTPSQLSIWLEDLETVLELYSAQIQVCSDSLKLNHTTESDAAQTVLQCLADDSFWLIKAIKDSQVCLDRMGNNLEKGGENA